MSSICTPWLCSSLRASGTSGSFLKPKCNVTCQQQWPSGSTSTRRSNGIQGTSWWLTVTNRFCSCSTLLCLRLCSSALGVLPFSADRNTAVPVTRTGGLMKTASRKLSRSMASSRRRLLISLRPCFQVIISVNITPPMTSGNQPPSRILVALAAKNSASTTKKKPVAAMHSAHG